MLTKAVLLVWPKTLRYHRPVCAINGIVRTHITEVCDECRRYTGHPGAIRPQRNGKLATRRALNKADVLVVSRQRPALVENSEEGTLWMQLARCAGKTSGTCCALASQFGKNLHYESTWPFVTCGPCFAVLVFDLWAGGINVPNWSAWAMCPGGVPETVPVIRICVGSSLTSLADSEC